MRYYKRYATPINIRGYNAGRNTLVYHPQQTGSGFLGTIVKGGLKLAKKHINMKNMKKAGKFVGNIFLDEGKKVLKKHKKKALESASDILQKQSKKVFQQQGLNKAILKDTMNDVRKVAMDVKPTLQESVTRVKKRVKKRLNDEGKAQINSVTRSVTRSVINRNDVKSRITDKNSLLLSNILSGKGIVQKKRGRPFKQQGTGIRYV